MKTSTHLCKSLLPLLFDLLLYLLLDLGTCSLQDLGLLLPQGCRILMHRDRDNMR